MVKDNPELNHNLNFFMMTKLMRMFFLSVTLLCYGCSDEKVPFQFDKEDVKGREIPVTVENVVGLWRIHRQYSEYHDLTACSPTLRSGYIQLSDNSVDFCQDTVAVLPKYSGKVNYESLDQNFITMNMSNANDNSDIMPEVRMEITKLTDSQMSAKWIQYDSKYVSSQGVKSEVLVEYTFKGGSLDPTVCKDNLNASPVGALGGVTIHTTADETTEAVMTDDPDIIGVNGWGPNVDEGNTRNVNFTLTCSDASYVIVVDSMSFLGFRIHNNPEGASELKFYSSDDGSADGLVANSKQIKLATNNDAVVETKTEPLTRPVKGNEIMLALTSRVRSGVLYVKGIRVWGKVVKCDRLYYEYIFNRE